MFPWKLTDVYAGLRDGFCHRLPSQCVAPVAPAHKESGTSDLTPAQGSARGPGSYKGATPLVSFPHTLTETANFPQRHGQALLAATPPVPATVRDQNSLLL